MQRLGRVLHVSPSKNIIVKIENMPKIGDTVVDDNLKPMGRICDIFGAVSSPYAAVKPTVRELGMLKNTVLYVLPSKKRKER